MDTEALMSGQVFFVILMIDPRSGWCGNDRVLFTTRAEAEQRINEIRKEKAALDTRMHWNFLIEKVVLPE